MQEAVALIAAVLLACGGHAPPPPKPQSPPAPDPKQLAHDIDDDMVQLARIVHDARGNCSVTISQLQTHVIRMRAHHDAAFEMGKDQALATRLVTEMDAYAKDAQGRGGQILADLAATHRACGAGCAADATCPARYQLERVIGDIPTY